MESWEGILQWMTVLWERGFTHDNPQGECWCIIVYKACIFRMLSHNLPAWMPFAVRCLVMQSFLDIAWERYKVCTQIIPRGFVLGSLTWFERCSSPQGFRLVLFILILIQYNMLDSALKETKLFYFIVRYVFEQLLY
jgi:hypothetical protein